MSTIDLIKQWCQNEGYKYKIDDDGNIQFKYQGITLFCPIEKSDQLYLQILMPNIYDIKGNRTRVLEAINTLCLEKKCIKAFIYHDSLSLAIEMLIDTSPELEDFFERCCDILIEGCKFIATKILD